MPNVSRTQDLGHGFCKAGHPGIEKGIPVEFITTYVQGADTVFMNNNPVTIVGSIGVTDCGHTTTAVSGSGTVFAENMPVHRLSDVGVINEGDGEYESIVGSDDGFAGD